MTYGIRKGLEDIAFELKGVRAALSAMWRVRYENDETDVLHPEVYADEFISTEECARRLGVSDQTIRNWIAIGRKDKKNGWKEGLHYVNISPIGHKKAVIRIPWNELVRSVVKNRKTSFQDFTDGHVPIYRQFTAKKDVDNKI